MASGGCGESLVRGRDWLAESTFPLNLFLLPEGEGTGHYGSVVFVGLSSFDPFDGAQGR